MRRASLALALLALASPAGASDPAVDYLLHCQGCHLADGSGKPGAVPPLGGSVGRFLQVEGGREFLVRVPGSSQSALDDARLAALLNWMVRRFGPVPGDFAPFTAREVSGVRRPPLTEVTETRRRLIRDLERIPSQNQPVEVQDLE